MKARRYRELGVVGLLVLMATSGAAAVAPSAMPAAAESIVYESQHGDAASLVAWSRKRVSGKMLGPFTSESVSLLLKELPRHGQLRVRAELVLIGKWTGASSDSRLMVSLDDKRKLLNATFTTPSDLMVLPYQSFPDNVDGAMFPAMTGSTAKYVDWAPLTDGRFQLANAVFELDFTFPHSADAVRVDFQSAGHGEKLWGVGKVTVTTLPEAPGTLDAKTFAALTTDLKGNDPKRVVQAIQAMVAAGDGTVDHLAAETVEHPMSERVAKLVPLLDDASFARRTEAQKELKALGSAAFPWIRKALAEASTEETRARLKQLALEMPLERTSVLEQRIGRVLDLIGTPKAARLVASSPDSTRLRAEAGLTQDEWTNLARRIETLRQLASAPASENTSIAVVRDGEFIDSDARAAELLKAAEAKVDSIVTPAQRQALVKMGVLER